MIDAIDDGVVFVRDGSGTRTWDSATGDWADFAGPATRVADVRNGVVLYDGPAPDRVPGDWRLVAGAIDAQLTYDGAHVLYVEQHPRADGARRRPARPRAGPGDGQGLGFWTIDTDGSVLVMTTQGVPRLPSTTASYRPVPARRSDPSRPTSGDPMFIGNDM